MGGELLNESSPTHKKTYSETFEDNFPFYLAIGMSYAEYWEGDPSLTQYYRKAYKIKQDEMNNNAWLQGLYIYDAVSTAIGNAFKGKNSRRSEYARQPYDFRNKEKTPAEKAKEVEVEQRKAAAWMEQFVMSQSHRARANK